jgi:hypothetical protein
MMPDTNHNTLCTVRRLIHLKQMVFCQYGLSKATALLRNSENLENENVACVRSKLLQTNHAFSSLWQNILLPSLMEFKCLYMPKYFVSCPDLRGPFERFVDWRQCTALMQREAVTVMLSWSGGGNVVVE